MNTSAEPKDGRRIQASPTRHSGSSAATCSCGLGTSPHPERRRELTARKKGSGCSKVSWWVIRPLYSSSGLLVLGNDAMLGSLFVLYPPPLYFLIVLCLFSVHWFV